MKFSPSLMCMDFLKLKEQTEKLNPLCDAYHVDIMDGHFVPNITLSPDFVSAFARVAQKPIDCHLMVTDPTAYLKPLQQAGATLISPHAEVISNYAFRFIEQVKAMHMQVGVTLNPATPLEWIYAYADRLDKVTLMSVDAGFAGQTFVPACLPKIQKLQQYKKEHGLSFSIEVDGGCNEHTFAALAKAGAEVLVVGSSGLFSLDENVEAAFQKMLVIFQHATEYAEGETL